MCRNAVGNHGATLWERPTCEEADRIIFHLHDNLTLSTFCVSFEYRENGPLKRERHTHRYIYILLNPQTSLIEKSVAAIQSTRLIFIPHWLLNDQLCLINQNQQKNTLTSVIDQSKSIIFLWNTSTMQPMTGKWMTSYVSNKSPTCSRCLWDIPAGLLVHISHEL